MKDAGLIVNYFSLKKTKGLLTKIERFLKNGGIKPEVIITKYHFHAFHIAKELSSRGKSLIILVGGDGTINEVINGILNSERKKFPVIGIIPFGTGIDFAKSLSIPAEIEKACEIIINGKIINTDVGKVIYYNEDNEQVIRYFINVLDIGLGGHVVRIASKLPRFIGGKNIFLLSSLIGLLTYKPSNLEVNIDTRFIEKCKINILGAANGSYFGGGMHIAPAAKIDDGVLEFLYVKDTNILRFIIEVLLPVYKAEHLKYKNLIYMRGKTLKVKSDETFLFEVDGEPLKAKELEIILEKNKIKIKAPIYTSY